MVKFIHSNLSKIYIFDIQKYIFEMQKYIKEKNKILSSNFIHVSVEDKILTMKTLKFMINSPIRIEL